MESDEACQIVYQIITQHGDAIVYDKDKFRTLFISMGGKKYTKQLNGLYQSMVEEIPQEMLKNKNDYPFELFLSRFCICLHEKYGLTEELARWTISSWGYAFGLIKDELNELEQELNEFKKSKELWEIGELPWSWWTMIGMRKEQQLIERKKELIQMKKSQRRNKTYVG